MMKLLLAVIATCALVVSPTCIKIKHQLRSNAPTIHVLISNGNTQMTSQVGRNGSHRFITDNLSSMTLAPAGTQTITLSYDEIFPITNAAVCTEVHPLSAGGCADGVCCKISISMYTITDAIIMTARVNNRNADGNPQFWKCEQEIQVPGVTNTELSPEELVTDILASEKAIGVRCNANAAVSECGTNAVCLNSACTCLDIHISIDGTNCIPDPCDGTCHDDGYCDVTEVAENTYTGDCKCNTDYWGNGMFCAVENERCATDTTNCHSAPDQSYGACSTGYVGVATTCSDIDECTTNTTLTCHRDAQCTNTPAGSYTCTCNAGYSGVETTGEANTCCGVDVHVDCPEWKVQYGCGVPSVANQCKLSCCEA